MTKDSECQKPGGPWGLWGVEKREGGREGRRKGEKEGGRERRREEGDRKGVTVWGNNICDGPTCSRRSRILILGNTEHYNDCVIVGFHIN